MTRDFIEAGCLVAKLFVMIALSAMKQKDMP